ncbi:MAG: cytochrome c oxidase assembly protein [Candidatus Dormibacteria bacterium]
MAGARGGWRRPVAISARVVAVVCVALAATGLLPRLALVQAALTGLLTMALPPLCLLNVREGCRADRLLRRVSHPVLSVFLLAAAAIAAQAPPVVLALSAGGPLTVLALGAVFIVALGFWSVLISPAPRLKGVYGAAYIIAGGMPISMPSMLIMALPHDLYAGLHAVAPPGFDPMLDQQVSGFILFIAIKVAIFSVASAVFFAAARASEAGGGRRDDDREPVPQPPGLPGWVGRMVAGGPTADEPGLVRRP